METDKSSDTTQPEAQASTDDATATAPVTTSFGGSSAKAAPSETAKPKNSKGKYVVGGVIIVLLIAGLTVGLLGYLQPKAKKTASVQPATTTTTTPAALVSQATSTMTSGATNESTVTNTDDSADATDASTSAGNVGTSVNENTF